MNVPVSSDQGGNDEDLDTSSEIENKDFDFGPEGAMIHIRCKICKDFLDEPHCDHRGCVWCFRCGPHSIKD